MSLRACQILLPAKAADALRDALERALRRQKAPPRPRTLLAALADGWAAVVEPGREGVDGGLARLLSELLSCEVLALELDGGALSLRLRRFKQGEPQEGLTPLGLAADVEALAWRALREAGVPPSLRLCGPDTLQPLAGEVEEGGFAALLAEASAQGVSVRAARALPPERSEGEDPPAHPDLWVESVLGEQCALEVRTLPACAPSPELAAALAAVEEAQALRLSAHLAAHAEAERLSRIAFAYRTEREAELMALLSRARAARPLLSRLTAADAPPPLSPAGFTGLCRAALERALPGLRVLRAHALRLELPAAAPGASLRAPLAQSYAAYLRATEEPADPAAPVVDAVRALLAEEAPALADLPLDALLAGLLPAVALVPPPGSPERAAAPLAGPLCAALLHDDGTRIREVGADALSRAGLSFDQALQRACENAEALTLAQPRGVSYFDLDAGRVVVFDFDDPAGAGRVLSPHARGLLIELLGEPCLCTVPTRDALLACSMLEPEAIEWVEEESQRRAAEGPFSLAPTLLVVTRDSVAPSGASDLSASMSFDTTGE